MNQQARGADEIEQGSSGFVRTSALGATQVGHGVPECGLLRPISPKYILLVVVSCGSIPSLGLMSSSSLSFQVPLRGLSSSTLSR